VPREEVVAIPSGCEVGDLVFAKIPFGENESISVPAGWSLLHYHMDNGEPFAIYCHTVTATDPSCVAFTYTEHGEG
jgi:hypothetical protein